MSSNNTSNSSNSNDRKTVGQKIDEVLEPFVTDRARLRTELKDQTALRAKIDDRMKEIQQDLTVIERSMLEALREAAAHDPVLSAAFRIKPEEGKLAGAASAALAGVSASTRRSDSNPLLNPAGA